MIAYYTLTIDPHSRKAHENYDSPITGTLPGITSQLVAIADETGADLSADHWAHAYWANPESFTLDNGEQTPEKPAYTEEEVKAIASKVFDEAPAHITLDFDYMAEWF